MSGIHIELSDRWTRLFQRMIYEWGYDDESQVVEAALKLLEAKADDPDAWRQRVQERIQEGIDDLDAGRSVEVRSDEDVDALFHEIQAEVAIRLGKSPQA
jgi:Arc/MetJ-type ribon-helix-helix transcriptional regulator